MTDYAGIAFKASWLDNDDWLIHEVILDSKTIRDIND